MSLSIAADDPLAESAISAIHEGNIAKLEQLLHDYPDLASATILDRRGTGRTLLHVVADWPGHFPNGPRSVAALIAAGADANAPVLAADRSFAERPLHWAASSDDVGLIDALLDGGADIEAPGAVFTGGSAMSDAVVFAQWRAAVRLLERGARTNLPQAAALGLIDRVEQFCDAKPPPSSDEITNAFWNACRGGQRRTAEFLLGRGANKNWIGWDRRTPVDVALESGATDLVAWLRDRGANTAQELT
jgi:ankyrin repeat protein